MSARAGWPLVLLIVVAGAAALPDVFDLDALKLGLVALLAAVALLPWMLWRGRAGLAAWLTSGGALLYLGSVAWALVGALGALGHAAVADRLLGALLAMVAAALGVTAAWQARSALRDALLLLGVLAAVVATLQAVGLEHWLTTGPDEIVSLMGNTTRAGALLALCVAAAVAALLGPDPRDPAWKLRLAAWVTTLGVAALLLTRARGGWLAAAAGVAAVGLGSRGAPAVRWRSLGIHLALGVGLALVLGEGPQRLLSSKLDADAPLLSSQDVTTQVRLSIWRGTLAMSAQRPLSGWGLGRFREQYPPFREPAEAALPGLAGARTEVDHPHDEFLLALAEGGWPAALGLLAFALATLARAARAARRGDAGDRVALGVLVAGTVAALVQNAWVSPGTALPVFAAAGWAWAPAASRAPGPRASAALVAGGLAAMLVLVALAVPRVRVQLGMREFLRRTLVEQVSSEGLPVLVREVSSDNLPVLVRAADADPGDVDCQRLLVGYGSAFIAGSPQVGESLRAPVERARQRLAELAPHVPAP